MSNATRQQIKDLCRQFGLDPRRTSGMHFLTDNGIADQVVRAAEPLAGETVLEIGPGLGILTEGLVGKADQVIAVELERRAVAALAHVLKEKTKLSVIHDDIFHWWKETGRRQLATQPYVLVSNLPYAISAPVLREFLTTDVKPTRMVIMVQKEFAERVMAQPGDMSLLALSVQLYADVKHICLAPRDRFWPVPGVDSSVIRLTNIRSAGENDAVLFRLARAAFAGRRKQLRNSLSSSLHLEPAAVEQWLRSVDIDPGLRPQALGIEDWQRLAKKSTSSPF